MSEPLSSVEIEDVLSSIRRLVSEDLRPMTRAPQTAPVEGPKPALILTPALRVVPDAVVPEPTGEPPIEAVLAAVTAAVGARSEEWEPETGDAAPGPDAPWDDTDWSAAGEAGDHAGFDGLTDAGPGDAMLDAEQGHADPGDVDPEAVDPEGTDPEAADLSEGRIVDEPTDAERPGHTGVADAQAGWAQQGAEDADVAGPAEAAAPAQDPADAEWVDEAEAEVIAALEHPEPGPTAARFNLLNDQPEMTFDEEVLRDLVRDLIREELQGHLGERITRNIRKLVRAEIARALAAAELD